MSKAKTPLNANTKRFLYVVVGGTLVATSAIIAIATMGNNKQVQETGSASIGNVTPRTGVGQGEAMPSPAMLERLERVHQEESRAAQVAGTSYIPENYLGSPEAVRQAIDSGELEERVTPSYQHHQQATNNLTRSQSVSVSSTGGTQGLGPLQDGVMRQMELLVRSLAPATVTTVSISDFGVKDAREREAQQALTAQQAGAPVNAAQGAPLIQADEILNALLVTPIDTYVTRFALAEIQGGPFNGAQVRGEIQLMSASGDVEDVGIRFTSMIHNGIYYPISAIALNEKTATDAMDASVDRRYLSRYVMPVIFAGLSGASTYFTVKGTPSESVLRGEGSYNDIVVARERADRQDALNQGYGDALDRGRELGEREVDRQASRPQQVTLPALTPIGLIFNQPVFSN